MKEDSIELTSRDGIRIQAWRWAPEGTPRGVVQVGGGPTQRVRRRRAGLGPAGPQVRVGVDVRHACAVPSAPSALSRCARTNHWNFSSSWSWPISRSFVTRSSFSVASAAERCARMTPV